ncbi:hypothetical protein EXIGLDRAFT_830261 [Exidia glandulosa HHB12029]|uniref:DUF6535 domain-containing protein n=1 Tax=Exidia glandulosa HHB12029 TaxID=1314781 RepID=A0A165NQ64_EXIGL|nr:hypothetical protein EXIGLDRAFT_830261 [Exidia glandulosa HHB12029]
MDLRFRESDSGPSRLPETVGRTSPYFDFTLPPPPRLWGRRWAESDRLSPRLPDEQQEERDTRDVLHDHDPVWRVYRDEMAHHDKKTTIAEWTNALDVLLIAAGLFSVVAAIFLASTYANLKPQSTDVTTAVRALIDTINRAGATANLALPALVAGTAPLPLYRAINALWFTSLFISVSVAFTAVLAKQWLDNYTQRVLTDTAPSATWARKRQFFANGLHTWHMSEFIGLVLPLMLHISLGLFLAGIALLTWTLDRVIAYWVITMCALLGTFYFMCDALPLLKPACPTSTPMFTVLRILVSRSTGRRTPDDRERFVDFSPAYRFPMVPPRLPRTPDIALAVHALEQLFLYSTSSPALSHAFQAMSRLPPDSIRYLRVVTAGMTALGSLRRLQPGTQSSEDVIRALGCDVLLGHGSWDRPILGLDIPDSILDVRRKAYYPEGLLLAAAVNHSPDDDDNIFARLVSTTQGAFSLSSVVLQLLRLPGRIPPRSMLYLLLQVDFRSSDLPLEGIARRCTSPDQNHDLVDSDNEFPPSISYLSLILSFVLHLPPWMGNTSNSRPTNQSPSAFDKIIALLIARIIVPIVFTTLSLESMGLFTIREEAIPILDLMARSDSIWSGFPLVRETYGREIGRFMLDMPYLWRGGAHFSVALRNLIDAGFLRGRERSAYQPTYLPAFDDATLRISGTLNTLLEMDRYRRRRPVYVYNSRNLDDIIDTILPVLNSCQPAQFDEAQIASTVASLKLATALATGLVILWRQSPGEPSYSLITSSATFRTEVRRLGFISRSMIDSEIREVGIHFMQHYRRLVTVAPQQWHDDLGESYAELNALLASYGPCQRCWSPEPREVDEAYDFGPERPGSNRWDDVG